MACYNIPSLNLLVATTVISSLLLVICVKPSSPEIRSFSIGRPPRLYETTETLNQLRNYKYPNTHFKKYPVSWLMGVPEDDTDAIPNANSYVGNQRLSEDDNLESKVQLEDGQIPKDPLLLLLESYPQLTDNDWGANGPTPNHETMTGTSQWTDLQDTQENQEVVPAELPRIGSDTRKKRAANKSHPRNLKHPFLNLCRLFNQLCPTMYIHEKRKTKTRH